jgi:peptidoglycan hydrolase CwlO-like protein
MKWCVRITSFFIFLSLVVPQLSNAQESVAEREARLRAELDKVMAEINEQQQILNQKRAEGASIQRDIAILTAKINLANAKIRSKQIAIDGLGKDISKRTETIKDLETRIAKNKESLAQLIRKTREYDNYSLTETVLAQRNLSEFFSDLDTFIDIKEAMQVSFTDLRTDKSTAETERQQLDKKRFQEIDEKVSVEAERRTIQTAEKEKQRLLALSKQEQANYAAIVREKEAKAAQIRTALFALRDTSAIQFGDALKYAQAASRVTGVRPAFILAILTQESNLGQHVGSCYLTDAATGSGRGANTGTPFARVMNPTRDVPIFMTLMRELGRDPSMTRVSCPVDIGWGGAMGPAQFIPSTWNGMKASIASAVGTSVPDPWNPQHAIMASALFLRDLGAAAGGYSAEVNAACKYYSGRACAATSYGAQYGNSVMGKAITIQSNIDYLAGP